MLARFASVIASLLLLSACSGCANRASQRVSQPPPPPSEAPAPVAPVADAPKPKATAPVDAWVILEADGESWVLVAPLPAAAAKGAKRSIELGGHKLLVKNERPVDAPVASPMTFTLFGAANDARCTTTALSHATIRLSDAKASWDAYRVKPCPGRSSFIAVRGAHENIQWIEPKAVEIAAPRDVRAYDVTLAGVAARITEITTLGRDRQCTHVTGVSVSIRTDDGTVDLDDASVRGAVLVEESAIVLLVDPRAPSRVQVVRIANGQADRTFDGELDNHQDGVDCYRG